LQLAAQLDSTEVSVRVTQHTVPGAQFAAPLHFSVMPGFCSCGGPGGAGQVAPATHEKTAP
jgi:hypothetical protein